MSKKKMIAPAIESDGYGVVRGAFIASEIDRLTEDLTSTLQNNSTEAVRRSPAGHVFAARNLMAIWPQGQTYWRHPQMIAELQEILGPEFGLMRAVLRQATRTHVVAAVAQGLHNRGS
jgi:hypothetical protein